jgi:separase
MAICPTGDILITSFRASNEGEPIIKTVCIFTNGEDNIHENVIVPLDQIIDRSQKQLRGIDEETQSAKYNDEASKRKWWNERHSIDEDLCSLLQTAQDSYFGHDLVRRLLLSKDANVNRSNSDDDSSDCSDIGPGNLASRFEAAEHEPVNEFDEEAERLALKKLTVTTLKEKLNSFGVESSRIQKMRKADLLDLVILEMEKDFQETTSKICIGTDGPEATTLNSDYSASGRCEPCSILILDENLHRLPLESMDMFANTAVTRMPSLPFLFATLYESQSANDGDPIPQVDPAAMKFILDPEQNLSETASKMEPALNSMASANGWEWKGCVGEMPTQEFMSDTLTQEHGLLLYCGHGGGEKFFSRSQVEDLINCYSEDESERHRGCSSTIVLMGCSSGKLKSVNCPKSPSGPDYPMHYEPEGIILSYIYAGAPCVVGNLWDVTDRDIDR